MQDRETPMDREATMLSDTPLGEVNYSELSDYLWNVSLSTTFRPTLGTRRTGLHLDILVLILMHDASSSNEINAT